MRTRNPRVRARPRCLVFLVALGLAASARADLALESCPLLPAGSGLSWSYQGGTDFGVCYATLGGSSATVIGIYFGNEPNFDPSRATPAGSGVVGGWQVVWYRRDSPSGSDAQSVQTLIRVSKRYVAHVWVSADSQAQLRERLEIVKLLAFRG